MDEPAQNILLGRIVSAGLAEGMTFVHRDIFSSINAPGLIKLENIEQEMGNLDGAMASISVDLLLLAARVEKEMNSHLASVFQAHEIMLNDPFLKKELQSEISENLVSASCAVKSVFLRWEKRFRLMETQVAQYKGDDMRDLSNRMTNRLAGVVLHPLEAIPKGSILVARRMLPSDTVYLSQNTAAAVLLEYGGAGSHAALFAREMGLPCIAGIDAILDRIPPQTNVLVDAHKGEVILCPDKDEIASFRHKCDREQALFIEAKRKARGQALTQDGVAVNVLANIGCRADTDRAVENGAEGIGLYRTEQIYIGRTTPPSADELFDEMLITLEPMGNAPICVRLLDIGADKTLPFTGMLAETNPALGRRGIRFLREYPLLLETQLAVILRLSWDFDISLLIPMVTVPGDITVVRECLDRLLTKSEGGPCPKLGAMIETPAAALSARKLAPYVDFLSFGTNDLTQYAFACDRDNAAVEHYSANASETILRLIEIVHSDVPDMPLSVCGEMAGDREVVAGLLSCGIRTLSMPPPVIPGIKEAIRGIEHVSLVFNAGAVT